MMRLPICSSNEPLSLTAPATDQLQESLVNHGLSCNQTGAPIGPSESPCVEIRILSHYKALRDPPPRSTMNFVSRADQAISTAGSTTAFLQTGVGDGTRASEATSVLHRTASALTLLRRKTDLMRRLPRAYPIRQSALLVQSSAALRR